MPSKLRGRGPRTFISYAFGNQLAPQLKQILDREGFPAKLVDDTELLGKPSLTAALEGLVTEAELVVRVLDTAANQSSWVAHELAIAKKLRRVIIPVVEDEATLPESVRDIPYLTREKLSALVPSALSRYGLLPLDPRNPCYLAEEPLQSYLRSETRFIRAILDSNNLVGHLLESSPAAVEQATKAQPQLTAAITKQVRDRLEACVRKVDGAETLAPAFRMAVEHALRRYGAERPNRARAPWQRMVRLTSGAALLRVAEFLPASAYPGFWGEAAPSIDDESKAMALISGSSQKQAAVWALEVLGDEAPNGWFSAAFQAGGFDFPLYLPKSGFIEDGLRGRDRPESFIEPYQWADFGLPQLLGRVLLEDRLSGSLPWSLEDYHSSSSGD